MLVTVTESKSTPAESSSTAQPTEAKPATNKAMIDFFSAIEEEQQSMFNPQTNRCECCQTLLSPLFNLSFYLQPDVHLLPTTGGL